MTKAINSAARALIAKLDAFKPYADSMCLELHIRNRSYSGPSYGAELEELREALDAEEKFIEEG